MELFLKEKKKDRISYKELFFFFSEDLLSTRKSARLRSTTPISGINSGSEDSQVFKFKKKTINLNA